jgi:hypothetical protein
MELLTAANAKMTATLVTPTHSGGQLLMGRGYTPFLLAKDPVSQSFYAKVVGDWPSTLPAFATGFRNRSFWTHAEMPKDCPILRGERRQISGV